MAWKEMKCNACSKSWYVESKDASAVNRCPYCGGKLPRPLAPGEIESLEQAIYYAVSAGGIEILSNAGRMRGLLMDTVCGKPDVEREIRIFFKFFEGKYLSMYQSAFSQELPEVEQLLAKIQYMLTEEEALDRIRAESLIRSCNAAICFYKGVEPSVAERAEEQYKLGRRYFEGDGVEQDDKKAVELFQKAAGQGYAEAQNSLGYAYWTGRGVAQDDKKAVEWYRKAAEQGDADAQYSLGYAYCEGRGVEQDDEKAVEWYRKAAEQGDADAQAILGLAYWEGQGVKPDDKKAVEWYRKAAEQGLAWAQKMLGDAYQDGRGVERDEKKAQEWYKKSGLDRDWK